MTKLSFSITSVFEDAMKAVKDAVIGEFSSCSFTDVADLLKSASVTQMSSTLI